MQIFLRLWAPRPRQKAPQQVNLRAQGPRISPHGDLAASLGLLGSVRGQCHAPSAPLPSYFCSMYWPAALLITFSKQSWSNVHNSPFAESVYFRVPNNSFSISWMRARGRFPTVLNIPTMYTEYISVSLYGAKIDSGLESSSSMIYVDIGLRLSKLNTS
mmetsp:Transcript_4255/g.14053  ORF Transcript_4255/g.14053 Transcript_4255/m.14053 type:complete len:159 (+) Transcript_4255:11-487(+)